jgi:23S rRNA pseudouridine2605 synthase
MSANGGDPAGSFDEDDANAIDSEVSTGNKHTATEDNADQADGPEEDLWDETSPEFDSEWDAPDADVQIEGDDGEPDPQRVVEAAPRTDPSQRANNAANQKTIDEMFDFLPGPEHTGDGERLQKVLARAGVGSRRVIEDLITARRIKVNGEIAVLGRRVDPDKDRITVDDAPVGTKTGLVYYLLNKPIGVVTTAYDPHQRPTVMDLVPEEPRVFPVGRLDVDTEGLLLLTNDGELTFRLTHPSYGIKKEYVAEVRGEPSQAAIRALRNGIELEDGITAPAEVNMIAPNAVRIAIHEGRNRQVRRMLEAVGHPVIRLVRVRIDRLADRQLPPGRWRELTPGELASLSEAVAGEPDRIPRVKPERPMERPSRRLDGKAPERAPRSRFDR